MPPRFERPLVWTPTGAHLACTRGPQRAPADADQVYAYAHLASCGAGGTARRALPPAPAKHDSALRAKANEGAGCSPREGGLVCAPGLCASWRCDRLRGRTACSLNASMRDHWCCSPGVRLCAVRARSALRASRRGELSVRAKVKFMAPPTLNAGTPARLTNIVTMATKHEGYRIPASRPTLAMSGRATASEAPLLNGPLDCVVGRPFA